MADRLPQEGIPSPRTQIVDADYILREQAPNMPKVIQESPESRESRRGFNTFSALALCIAFLVLALAMSRGYELPGRRDAGTTASPAPYLMTGETAAPRPAFSPAPKTGGESAVSLGVTTRQVSAVAAEYYNLRRENTLAPGLLVTAVEENSPAAGAGIRQGDVLAGFGGMEILSRQDLAAAESGCVPGQTVTLTVFRAGEYLQLEMAFPENGTE